MQFGIVAIGRNEGDRLRACLVAARATEADVCCYVEFHSCSNHVIQVMEGRALRAFGHVQRQLGDASATGISAVQVETQSRPFAYIVSKPFRRSAPSAPSRRPIQSRDGTLPKLLPFIAVPELCPDETC